MARSPEQLLSDVIVSDLLYWRKHGGGKLLHDPNCATNIGKCVAVEQGLAKLQEIRDRQLAIKKEMP